jgi:hypothetical protein
MALFRYYSDNIEPFDDLRTVGLADRDLKALDIEIILPNVIDLGDIDDIRAVYLDEALLVDLFLEVLDGIVGYIFFIGGHEFHVIAHAFHEKDIVVLQPHQFAIALDENMVVITGRGRISIVNELVNGIEEALIREGFLEEVRHIVFKSVVGIFRFGSGEYHFGVISQLIQQVEAGSSWHFDIQEEEIDGIFVQVFQRFCNIGIVCFYSYEAAFFTTTA